MNGWQTAIWGAACILGALMFLKLVANALAVSNRLTEELGQREAKAYRRRLEKAVLARGAEEKRARQEAA